MRRCAGRRLTLASISALNEALVVDGTAQPLDGFPHLESIYGGAQSLPATNVEIQYLEHLMRLDFGTPETSQPHKHLS